MEPLKPPLKTKSCSENGVRGITPKSLLECRFLFVLGNATI